MMMSANLGILLAFVAGDLLSFALVPRLFIAVPVLYLLTVPFFPETPFYCIRSNRETVSRFNLMFKMLITENPQKAIKSLEFYRNVRSGADRGLVDFDGELEKLKTADLRGDTEIRVPLTRHDFSESLKVNRCTKIITVKIMTVSHY